MIHRSLPTGKKAVAVLASFSLALLAARARAQFTSPPAAPAGALGAAAPVPVTPDAFGFELGQAVVDRGGGTSSLYTVAATQDYRSKTTGGKVQLTVVERDGRGTMTHLLTVNTGNYKTVAQLTAMLADIFRKDLDVPAANQEIGKIGDLNHGGEIRFVAESNDTLRYDWMTPGEPPHSTRFKRNDIQVFLGMRTHPKAGG